MIVTLARWDFILQGCQLDLVILSGLAIVFINRAIKKTVMQAFLSLTSGFNSARWLDAIPGSSFTWLIVPIMLNLLRVEKMTSSTALCESAA